MRFPSDKGTYVLILQLQNTTHLTIGKRGEYDFPAGWYLYVGSAFGSGGLRGRLRHHLKPVTKPHWHIDYLRAAAKVREIWYAVSADAYEHRWADVLCTLPDAHIPVPRFGASDCRCETHLIGFAAKPQVGDLQSATEAQIHTYTI
jgi:Uri superfamily endonuclease